MRLAQYLTEKDISPTEFARRLGKPQATISRYVNRQRIPDAESMALIVAETGGAVTPNDFYGLEPSEPAPQPNEAA